MKMIDTLQPHEVFVFGSNGQGFHGAGAAGWAFRGESGNSWRDDPKFLLAMHSVVGAKARVGKWAVFGVARGYQEGTEGRSYAIQTVTRPGAKRSVPLDEIEAQIRDLFAFARSRPDLTFLMTAIGTGYAGYTPDEMFGMWFDLGEIPDNVRRVWQDRP